MPDLDAVEARIWKLLDRFRGELEDATIYGMPSLRWPGSGAHDYFVAVKRSTKKVSIYAIAVDTWPEALDAPSGAVPACQTRKSTFSCPWLHDYVAWELDRFLTRLAEPFRAYHAGQKA